jgi:hypothetical protein
MAQAEQVTVKLLRKARKGLIGQVKDPLVNETLTLIRARCG